MFFSSNISPRGITLTSRLMPNRLRGAVRSLFGKDRGIDTSLRLLYPAFLGTLQTAGFSFLDFRRFLQAEPHELPDPLAVLRHDIHYRDIEIGRDMISIERQMLGRAAATYFVMWRQSREQGNARQQRGYAEFIEHALSSGFHVQPHVSTIEAYIQRYKPKWAEMSRDQLLNAIEANYDTSSVSDPREPKIVAKHDDLLNLDHLVESCGELLQEYLAEFRREFGVETTAISSHGASSLPSNLNTALINSMVIRRFNLPIIDAYDGRISETLTYRTDNKRPLWIDHPWKLERPGRFQFLIHPDVWDEAKLHTYRKQNGPKLTPIGKRDATRSGAKTIIDEMMKRGEDVCQFDVLDTNAGPGILTCPDICLRTRSLMTWEIDPALEEQRRYNLPGAGVRTVDMNEAIRVEEGKYDWIISDISPREYEYGNCENFGLFPHIFRVMKDTAFFTTNIMTAADKQFCERYAGVFTPRHLEARGQFYNTDKPESISFEEMAEAYVRWGQQNGFRTAYWFILPKGPCFRWFHIKYEREPDHR